MRTLNPNTLERVENYIIEYQKKNGKSPNYRQIMHGVGMSSLNLVQRYHEVLLGRYDGAQKVSSGRQGRVLESQGACKHRVNHERQNAYILPFGSKQLYTAAL